MGERVVHGVRAHGIQLRVPHTVLFGEQEGDKLSRTGREDKSEPLPQTTGLAVVGRRGRSVSVTEVDKVDGGEEQGGSPKENLAPGTQVGFWSVPPILMYGV